MAVRDLAGQDLRWGFRLVWYEPNAKRQAVCRPGVGRNALLLVVGAPFLPKGVFQIADGVFHTVEVGIDGIGSAKRFQGGARFAQAHKAARQAGLSAEVLRVELERLLAVRGALVV